MRMRQKLGSSNWAELGFEKYDQNQVSELVLVVLSRQRSNRTQNTAKLWHYKR